MIDVQLMHVCGEQKVSSRTHSLLHKGKTEYISDKFSVTSYNKDFFSGLEGLSAFNMHCTV